MSAPYLPTGAPWFYVSGAVYADPDAKVCIAKADRSAENPIPPVERDANMRAIAEFPSLIAVLETLALSVEFRIDDPRSKIRDQALATIARALGKS